MPQHHDVNTALRLHGTTSVPRLHDTNLDDHRRTAPTRLVIADRGAARCAGLPCDVSAWAPWRTSSTPCGTRLPGTLARPRKTRPRGHTRTVTYLALQDDLESKRLRAADHAALLDVLADFARTGVTVHVVDERTSWTERMCAVAQSSIVLSVFRDHVANAVFTKRGPQSALMEFFPVTAHVLKNAV